MLDQATFAIIRYAKMQILYSITNSLSFPCLIKMFQWGTRYPHYNSIKPFLTSSFTKLSCTKVPIKSAPSCHSIISFSTPKSIKSSQYTSLPSSLPPLLSPSPAPPLPTQSDPSPQPSVPSLTHSFLSLSRNTSPLQPPLWKHPHLLSYCAVRNSCEFLTLY